MKIAVTSKGTDLDSEVDPRFGRAAFIIIVDSETLDFEVIDNKDGIAAMKGAGIQAAKAVTDRGAEVLVTGFCGPNAMSALKAGNVRVASGASGSVKESVTAYLGGELSISDKANVEGHW
jgi:predicted Fe-Mo cluster-binding NifX family protein